MTTGYNHLKNTGLKGKLWFILKDSVLYGGAKTASKFFQILLVPILARLFTVEDFGIIDGITVIGAIILPLIIFGQDNAIAVYFYDKDDNHHRINVTSQGTIIQILFGIITCTVFFVFADKILILFFETNQYLTPFRILIISVFFQSVNQNVINILKLSFQRSHFIIMTLGVTTCIVILTFVFTYVLELGILGVFMAQLSSQFVFAIIGLYYIRNYFHFSFSLTLIKPLVILGFPYMLLGLSATLIPSIDRYFIVNHLTLGLLGIYAAANKLTRILQIPIGGFQTAWGPFAFALKKEPDAQHTYDTLLLYYSLLLVIFSLFFSFFSKQLILVFAGTKYIDGYCLVFPIAMALVIDSLCWITGIGIDISKKPFYSTFSYLISLAITFLSIWVLVSPYGIQGVAFGILLGKLAQIFSKTFFAYKFNSLRFTFKPVIIILVFAFLSYYSFSTIMAESILWNSILAAIFFGATIIVYWLVVIPLRHKNYIITRIRTGNFVGIFKF